MTAQRATIPMTTAPTCPSDTPPEVKKAFEWITGLLGRHATHADSLALLMLATSWTVWRKACADVNEQGHVVSSGGSAIANPALAVAGTAQAQILALCKECGLTLAARKKLLLRNVGDDEGDE
jgi:P27 family predicted phage terminase small subunit